MSLITFSRFNAPVPSLPDLDAILEELTGSPSATRICQMSGLIEQLRAGPISGTDIWAQLDMLQIYKAFDANAALVDWIEPTRLASAVNSPTFSADAYYQTNGTNSEIDTLFNPGDGGSYNFLRDDATFGVWQVSTADTTGSTAGWFDGTDGITLQARNAAASFGFRLNQSTGSTSASLGPDGLYSVARDGASSTEAYYNGVAFVVTVNPDRASTAVNNHSIRVGRVTTTGYTAAQFGAVFAGGALLTAEQSDIYNALLSYFDNIDAAETRTNVPVTLHMVRNGWDSAGRHFAAVGADKIYRSTDGGQTYSLVYTLPDSPGRIYGFFIASDDTLFVSGEYQTSGVSGRTYRSTDNGDNWTQLTGFDAGFRSGNIAFWNGTEDGDGNIYLGQYNVEDPALLKCIIWKSTDGGSTWTDISDSSWTNTNHVHDVKYDSTTGWLYATIGDIDGYDGVWRSKLKDGSDWVRKTTSSSYQWIPIEFDGTYVYVGDDENDGIIARFTDDGTGTTVAPTTVLTTGSLVNCYYLKRDPDGVFWAAFPPADAVNINQPGAIYRSSNGSTWERLYRHHPVTYADWFDEAAPASSLWTLQTGTMHWGSRPASIGNFFPLGGKGLRIKPRCP